MKHDSLDKQAFGSYGETFTGKHEHLKYVNIFSTECVVVFKLWVINNMPTCAYRLGIIWVSAGATLASLRVLLWSSEALSTTGGAEAEQINQQG